LPARFVIHTVGPVYQEENGAEPELLRSCYLESLRLAADHRFASVAFPSISTGMFGYPKREACDVAVATVIEWLATHQWPQRVIFCCFDSATTQLYTERLEG
jgi:O-acetyl-ADP-ribose deacetylase (regulator of RNase III)